MHLDTSARVVQLKDYINPCERATQKLSTELSTQDIGLVSSIMNLGSDCASQKFVYGYRLSKLVDEWLDVQKRIQAEGQLEEVQEGFFFTISKAIERQKRAQENSELICLFEKDNNINKAATLNTIEGYCVFVQLNDFSHDGRINTRKQFSDGIKLISEDYVPLYVFNKDDQFPEEDFSFVWKRE